MKKVTCLTSLLLIIAGLAATAQSISEGTQDLYYQKYQSAKSVLLKVITATPTNDEAYYFLGLADLGLDDKASAQADFAKGVQVNPNSMLNIVGMGRMDILNGQYDLAKQPFQQAFNLNKEKDMSIGAAILEATAQSPKADNLFALDLMKQLKADRKNRKKDYTAADYDAMGDAYLNTPNGGGNAANQYLNAISADSKYAEAYNKLGDLYRDARVDSSALTYWEQAIGADPNYVPAYYNLFWYYRFRDLDKAQQYLDKYTALTDDKVDAQAYLVDMLFARKDYQGAITKANQIMPSLNKVTQTRLYKLMAVSYNAMGDSLDAKKNMDIYFQRQDTSKLSIPFDYITYSQILSKLKEDSLANIYVAKAVNADTSTDLGYLRQLGGQLRKQGNFNGAALYYKKAIDIAGAQASIYDYFWFGLSQLYAGQIDSAIATFQQMAKKYPQPKDQQVAYYYLATSQAEQDTGYQGTAVDAYTKYISLISPTDSSKKSQLTKAYYYIATVDLKKSDFTDAGSYADKLVALDPQSPFATNIYGNLAATYVHQQDRNSAEEYSKKLLAIDPSNAIATQILNYYKALDKYNADEAKRKAAKGSH
ncbi:MAG TPA: tetratricopeptide repeat protein [Chitinophagaceae bacterium]|nr:tetratricopeptide repeat protein [Chitinophagaceae bacterium]